MIKKEYEKKYENDPKPKERLREVIIIKLTETLTSVPKTEKDIVYILVQVRKILEIDKNKDYGILNFFCNLTLHYRIDDVPKIIIEKLKQLKEHDDYGFGTLFDCEYLFKDFHCQLHEFLKKYHIPSFNSAKDNDLKELDSLLLDTFTSYIKIKYKEELFIDLQNIGGLGAIGISQESNK